MAGELCLSGDGKRLPWDPNGTAVHVYRWDAQSRDWDRLGDALEQPSGSDFGHAVSLSRDGSVLAVGAPDGSGSVRVFRWDASRASWSRMGVDIVGGPHDPDVPPARLGASVSLSLDGTRLAAAAPGAGVARVFGWDRAELVAEDGRRFDRRGGRVLTSIALSGDGSHLTVGASTPMTGRGRVVYRWTRTRDGPDRPDRPGGGGRVPPRRRHGRPSGSTVSLSRDGSRLAVGAERGSTDTSGSRLDRRGFELAIHGEPRRGARREVRAKRAARRGAILAVGQTDVSSGGWKVIAHALVCDPEAAGPPPNGRTGECSAVARLLNVTGGGANATCAPECHDGFDLTEASTCDPFTGGFRSGRCLCACDEAWRAKGFYM